MRSVMQGVMDWIYRQWRAAWQRNAVEFYGGDIETDPDAGTVTREGRRNG